MKLYTFPLGELGANCYVLETADKQGIAIDIGTDAPFLLRFLQEQEISLVKILLTHGHYDHIGGVAQVQAATGAEVVVHEADAAMLQDNHLNLSDVCCRVGVQPVSEYTTVTEGDTITVGADTFTLLHTPGHTPGSVCYLYGDWMFSGDTLFRMSIGRTDFPGGSTAAIRKSLKRLGTLEKNYTVYPGHGEQTTIAFEQANNAYLGRI